MTIARIYKAPFHDISVTNDSDQDIFEMVASSTKKGVLHGFSITSAQGVTAAELALLRLVRRSTTGTGGAAVTEVKTDPDNDVTPTVALNQLVTTPGTIGDIIMSWQWSQQGELLYLPTPEIREYIQKSGNNLCLHLGSALGGTRKWSGWVAWEEL